MVRACEGGEVREYIMFQILMQVVIHFALLMTWVIIRVIR